MTKLDAEAGAVMQTLWEGEVTVKTCTAAAANTFSSLTPGRYRIVSKDDSIYVMQTENTSSNAATSTTGSYLPADTIDYLHVTSGADDRISVISDSVTATVFVTKQLKS